MGITRNVASNGCPPLSGWRATTLLLSERGALTRRPVCVKGPRVGELSYDRATPDPRPPGPGPGPAAADADAGPDAAAAGPESAADLVGPRRAHADRAVGLRGALGHLRRAARRHRGERARPRRRSRRSELPALAAASFALSKLVVHEKVESWMRRPFVDETRRASPKGRRLRYAVGELLHVHALHRRLERARPRRAAAALARGRAHGLDGARRVGRQRPAAGRRSHGCARTRRPSRRSPPTRRSCAASAMPRDRCVAGVDMSCFGRQHSGPCHG